MAELASFWVGERLGPIEIACAQSFLRHGDRLTIFAPSPVDGIPDGVTIRDANEVMPAERIIRHRKSGSPALHSDLFRYALMAQTDMIWVDLDVLALRSFDGAGEWLFGHETDTDINGAVLRLPRDSKTLQRLMEFRADTVGLPPMLTGFRRFKYWLKSGGRGLTINRWPWGSIGPRAMTDFLRETGEIAHALPQSAFYEIPLGDVARFVTPGGLRRADLAPDAWAVHLWGKELRKLIDSGYGGKVPADSFLGRALAGEEL